METIKLDLVPGKKMPSLHASQFDDGRAYHIDLTENRVPYVLDGTETISVIVRKCDNTLVSMDIANTFADKSYIEFEVTEQMTACSGFNYGEIILEKNGDRLGSLNFYLQVEAAPDENGITSQSEIKNLNRQITDEVDRILPDMVAEEVPPIVEQITPQIVEELVSENYYDKEQADAKFTTIDNLTESETKTYSSAMIENKYATVFENALGDAGSFKPQSSWYATAGAGNYSVSNGVASFDVTAQYGGLRPANSIPTIAGHKYYLFGKVKASNSICLSFDGVGAVFSTGSEDFEFISNIYTPTTTRNRFLTVSDNNATGFGTVQTKNVGVIDLTILYGENTPAKATLDAKIAPMGALVSSATGILATRLYEDVEVLKNDVDTLKANVDTRTFKVIALGDSITAFGTGTRGWLRYFKERINCDIIANTAVDGAWLHDKVAATVYDGNPQPGDNNLNVLGNQVQKILNNNYDAPDLILIAVGTNSGINITEQQIKDVYYYNYQFVDLDNVDRTTDAGAYRWCLEKLHAKYPDAIIIWFSPIHGAEPTMKGASSIVAWGESLRIATAITGQQYIESFRCGICGYKEVMNAEGEYLQDGLHPNAKGAKKLGYYNASQVKNILMQTFNT